MLAGTKSEEEVRQAAKKFVRRIVRQPAGVLRRLSYDGCGPPIQRADSDHHRTVRRRTRVHHRRDARHEGQERQRLIITLSGMMHRSTR